MFVKSTTKRSVSLAILFGALLCSCSDDDSGIPKTLFTSLTAERTGIDFSNNLAFSNDFNIYTYRNFYNGGGVALGDVNSDGLIDVYFTGNQVGNRLYLNKGDFRFEDITAKAGVKGTQKWSTGVSMADVNGDGLLDIYVCSSGNVEGDPNKQNELFINNGDLTFTERAREYGVADKGYTTHAAFFDYDRDGDLDLYILNNSYQAIGSFNLRKNIRTKRDPLGGHKLLRNDNGKFADVSEQAGIFGSVIGFGLGVTVGDVNQDGWMDIFVSNDFFERDYLYINNQNGTFKECLPDQMKSISGASMGADLADLNNDALPDLFVTEMLPRENARLKTVTTFEDWNRYQYNVQNDYYHQFTRNMLQINNGDGTFSEVGRLAGVEATDWSWGALLFDLDNDGLKDIFVANGIYQDLTNQDFLQYASNEEFVKSVISRNRVDYKLLTEIIPSHPIANFAFRNLGGLKFRNQADEWGLGTKGFSNGSAYGDLDNDGDLDLVVNNVNMPAFVYRNEADTLLPENGYLKFVLNGEGKNTNAVGTKITAIANGKKFYVEQVPIRGFESTVDPRPHLGLGNIVMVDKLTIQWPDGRKTELDSVATNQTITLHQKDATAAMLVSARKPETILTEASGNYKIDFVHRENEFVDFDREYLIYHMLSSEGPRMSKGDVNGDGREDVFIGGARGFPGVLYVQSASGDFQSTNKEVFEVDKESEDLGSVFFDADGDNDQDLYVCSGGNEFSSSASALINRLYINDGNGRFQNSQQVLPNPVQFESTATVKAADADGDGDQDLFVGVRLKPFYYGFPVDGYILLNDGHGKFSVAPEEVSATFKKLGMITDAEWVDIDNDQDADLVVVGEYMPVRVFTNDKGKFTNASSPALDSLAGWWNAVEAFDADQDGDVDFVVGNHGLNSRFKATAEQPITMHVADFDRNGKVEHVIGYFQGGKHFPMILRHELISAMPSMKKKYLKYESYKEQTLTDVFPAEALKEALRLEVRQLASGVLLNDGRGRFTFRELPIEAQYAPVYGIETGDFNGDNKIDIVLGGNFYRAKPQVGRYDASYGLFLAGNGDGTYTSLTSIQSGLRIHGEVRDILSLNIGGQRVLVFSRNSDGVVTYKAKSN